MKKEPRKCLCDEPLCGKCLGVNCEDDNCLVHTLKLKSKYRNIEMVDIQPETLDESRVNKVFNVPFGEVLKQDKKDRT